MLFKEDEVARAEAKAVRENAAWYRWTHDLVEVTGPDAERFLDWMLVNTIAGTMTSWYSTRMRARGGFPPYTGRTWCAGSTRTKATTM